MDFFADTDTSELAVANRLVEGGLEFGFRAETLFSALDEVADGEEPAGLVYGAGFEDRIALLDALARRWTLFGNRPDVVRCVKAPRTLAGLCFSLGIRHPEVRFERPRDCRDWLVKSVGGSGGAHVAPADAPRANDETIYFQRMAPGEPVSILLLADGTDAHVLGTSRQWPAPAPDEPFRFGGSYRPAGVSPGVLRRLTALAKSIARAAALRGLNSIDLLVAGDDVTLIEINPRPGATLDIFEDQDGSLFRAHLEGCLGRLPELELDFSGAAAAGIAYARHEITSMPVLDWPVWAADLQRPRSRLRADDPICTIRARAEEPEQARRLLDERTAFILDVIDHMGKGAAS